MSLLIQFNLEKTIHRLIVLAISGTVLLFYKIFDARGPTMVHFRVDKISKSDRKKKNYTK